MNSNSLRTSDARYRFFLKPTTTSLAIIIPPSGYFIDWITNRFDHFYDYPQPAVSEDFPQIAPAKSLRTDHHLPRLPVRSPVAVRISPPNRFSLNASVSSMIPYTIA